MPGLVFTPSAQFHPSTVAERWDGSSWSVQDTPNLPGAGDIDPPAVSCPTLSLCTAAGGYTNNGPKVTLAEQWNRGGGSAPVTGGSLPTASHSVRSCVLPLAKASFTPDQAAPSLWFRWRAVRARPVSSETVKPPYMC